MPVVTSLKPFGFCSQAQPRLHSASRGPEGRRARLVDERVQEAERRFPGGKADAVESRENGRSRGRRGRSACHALRATCDTWGPSVRVYCQPESVSRSSSVPLTVHNHAVRVLLSTERRDVGVPAPAAHLETDQRMAHCGGAAMLRQPKEAAGPFGGLPTPCVGPQRGRRQRRLLLVRAHLRRRSARLPHGTGTEAIN